MAYPISWHNFLILLFVFESDELYELEEGNDQFAEVVARNSADEIRLKCEAKKVSYEEESKQFSLHFEGANSEKFDRVVISTPLELSNLELPEPAHKLFVPFEREFVTLNITIILGKLNPEFFGLKKSDPLPSTILSPVASPPFITLMCSKIRKPENKDRDMVHLFSHDKLSEQTISNLFSSVDEKFELTRKAYPRLGVRKETQRGWPALFWKGIYYGDALEYCVSTLETQIIAAKNTCILLLKNL